MNIDAIINTAIILSQKGRLMEAIQYMTDLLKYQPFNVKVLLNFNTLLMQEKELRHEMIKQNFDKIFQVEKDNEKAMFNNAIYLSKQVQDSGGLSLISS